MLVCYRRPRDGKYVITSGKQLRKPKILAKFSLQHLLGRLFVFPRHARQYAPFHVPNPPLDPRILYLFVGFRVYVG